MWRVCSEPFMNDKYIFPTQQRDVYKIIEECKKDENITKVIIFGSSVTSLCNPWSDIDVYMEMKEEKLMPVFRLEVPVDKWNNFMVDEDLMEEINEKGVIVYERDVV